MKGIKHMETLAELIKDISAEERTEMIKILNIELAASERINLDTEQTAVRRIIRNELLKASIST